MIRALWHRLRGHDVFVDGILYPTGNHYRRFCATCWKVVR